MSELSRPMPVEFTPLAAEKIRQALQLRGEGEGIRLLLVRSGCAGWSYAMQFVDESEAEDMKFQSEGFFFFIRKNLYDHIKGVVLDYKIKDLEEGFTFLHPNFNERCSCGKSFSCTSDV